MGMIKTDSQLIREFIEWAIKHDLTLTAMSAAVGRNPSWAGRLVAGKVGRLHFATRNRIIFVLRGGKI